MCIFKFEKSHLSTAHLSCLGVISNLPVLCQQNLRALTFWHCLPWSRLLLTSALETTRSILAGFRPLIPHPKGSFMFIALTPLRPLPKPSIVGDVFTGTCEVQPEALCSENKEIQTIHTQLGSKGAALWPQEDQCEEKHLPESPLPGTCLFLSVWLSCSSTRVSH